MGSNNLLFAIVIHTTLKNTTLLELEVEVEIQIYIPFLVEKHNLQG